MFPALWYVPVICFTFSLTVWFVTIFAICYTLWSEFLSTFFTITINRNHIWRAVHDLIYHSRLSSLQNSKLVRMHKHFHIFFYAIMHVNIDAHSCSLMYSRILIIWAIIGRRCTSNLKTQIIQNIFFGIFRKLFELFCFFFSHSWHLYWR
jgi:hypothetical protein